MTLFIPENHITFSATNEVDALCHELRSIGITYCSFVRIFDDGTRFDINNNAAVTAMYYNEGRYKNYIPEIAPESLHHQFSLIFARYQDDPLIGLLKSAFQIDFLLAYVKRFKNFYEVWHFGANPNNPEIVDFYLNRADFLKYFCMDFKKKGNHLIQRFSDARIQTNEKKLIHPHEADRFDFTNTPSLTKREMDCLQLLATGLTAKEIGESLNISYRTVDTHIENLKQKMGCTKISTLLVLSVKEGLI